MLPKRKVSVLYGTRCVRLFCRGLCIMLSQSTLTGKVLDGERDYRACHRASRWRDHKRRWLTHDCRTMRIRACCGRYIDHCAGGISICDPLVFRKMSSSPSFLCPRARRTIFRVRSSSHAARTSHPHPIQTHPQVYPLHLLAYLERRPTPPQTRM